MSNKKLIINSPTREKRSYNPKHQTAKGDNIVDVVTTNAKSYTKFKELYPGFSRNETRNNIHDYKAVLIALNEFYVNYMIETGNLIILPQRLGKLGIRKFKKPRIQKPDGTFNMPLDMNILKTTGQRVYHTNDHTDGNSFQWLWLKPRSMHGARDSIKGFFGSFWKFKPARSMQLLLARTLKQEGYDWDKYHYMTDAIREKLIQKRLKNA